MPTSTSRPLARTLLPLAIFVLLPTLVWANWLGGVDFGQLSPGYLPHYLDVTVSFDYKITEPEGARIYVMPMTDGAPTPGSQFSSSAYLSMGEGRATRIFRVDSGMVTVDQVRIRMKTFDDDSIILDYFVDAEFHFSPYGIFDIQIGKPDHSTMIRGEDLNIGFAVVSPGPDNVLVVARPYFDDAIVPGFEANAVRPMAPRGSGHQHFDYPDIDADINRIRFTMSTADGSTTLLEFDLEAHYFWREMGITNLSFSEPSPSSLHHSQNVLVTFDYNNPTVSEAVIEARPYLDGSPAPDGEFETGTTVPAGSTGSSSRYFGSTGTTDADAIRLVGTEVGGATTFLDIMVPVSYSFTSHALPDLVAVPGSPAVLDFDEDLVFDFDYMSDHPGEIRFEAVPYSGGAVNPDFVAGISILNPAGSGSASASFRLLDSAALIDVDEVRISILDDLNQVLNVISIEGDFSWRGIGWASPVPQHVAGPRMLGQNYPNPFNPTTTIPLMMAATGPVRLAVYDLRGRLVRTLVDRALATGSHEIPFDGRGLASGTYHYRLETGEATHTRTMTLVK